MSNFLIIDTGTASEFASSIADSERDQQRYIRKAVKECGQEPSQWTKEHLGLVSVKAKHIGEERAQLVQALAAEGGDPLERNAQDTSYEMAVQRHGRGSVDSWSMETMVAVATQAKEHWEGKGITF